MWDDRRRLGPDADTARRTPPRPRGSLAAEVLAALAASACCLGPVVLLGLGLSGAWVGSLSALEPVRPLFVLATGGFLGVAYARIFGDGARSACDPGAPCAAPGVRRFERAAFWIVTATVAGLLLLPSWLGARAAKEPATVAPADAAASAARPVEVVLAVTNLTCEGCLHTLRGALADVPGVRSVRVSLVPPQAVVVFDPARTTVEALTRATEAAGYPSRAVSRNAAAPSEGSAP